MRRRDSIHPTLTDAEKWALYVDAENLFEGLSNDDRREAMSAFLADHGTGSIECLKAAVALRRAARYGGDGGAA